jgi:hypothetical protein
MSLVPTTTPESNGGRRAPKAARRDRRLGEPLTMGSARTLDSLRSERPPTDSAPLTARAKSFEAKADMIELSPMPEEARRFFFAGCFARDRHAEARPAAATCPSVTKQRDPTLSS